MAKLIIEIPDDEYNYFMSDECFDADDGFDAIEYICNGKPLEQESILDKIRAEIDNALSDGMIHKKTVIGIIDKYKGESEGEEPEI